MDKAHNFISTVWDLKSNFISSIWDLKSIEFGVGQDRKSYRIVTENHNGPCSFIAICNILILRGEMEIPVRHTSVSYKYLSQLVVNHSRSLNAYNDSSKSIVSERMPKTQEIVELNPVFTESKSFGGPFGIPFLLGRLGIEPVHGWLVDPESPEAETVSEVEDHDSAVSLIAKALINSGKPSEERTKAADTMRKFFHDTRSQLTRYGISQLASTTEPGALMVLYRNFHLSVLYKRDALDDPGLYSLVTDQCLSNEPSVVWERVEDLNGGGSPTFVDSRFIKSSAAVDMQRIRSEQQLRSEELQSEILRAEIDFQRGEQAKEDLRAEGRRSAEKECLAEIWEWLQKRKEYRATRAKQHHRRAKQGQAPFDRAELWVENIEVKRSRREFDRTSYCIEFHANSGSRRQSRHAEAYGWTAHQLTEYFDGTTLDMEDCDITVLRRVSAMVPLTLSFQARPRLSQQQRPQVTQPDVNPSRPCIIM
ncbi:hypothetical protein BDP27DRAFT_1450323 [Rhodocollybia butyracea]|uniref:MINDY deubiquitinase domain-containing protein n=1 Tax=Rhodocollybia butyracea TaxID=206335 RepID=A0A9P5PH05_9AGAR|nr:hypothetical protein BDP27DRAFT_1450323 [Rhodocollybia butyracea]